MAFFRIRNYLQILQLRTNFFLPCDRVVDEKQNNSYLSFKFYRLLQVPAEWLTIWLTNILKPNGWLIKNLYVHRKIY